jgi:MATE family multidrug resistance protein
MAELATNLTGVGRAVDTRTPLEELLALALPTVAQMASYTLMQFVDTWFLAHTSDSVDAPTAAANSGMLAFSIISLGMGVLWVVNTLVSQNFGRKNYAACGRFLWQGIWFALVFSALLLPGLPYVSEAFRLVGHERRLVALETIYLQIVVGASVLKLIGTAFGQFLLSIDRPLCVMTATVIGVTINAVAAWVLVFGHWGVRPMGVAGAAWGQNVGVLVETSCLIGFTLVPSIGRTFNVADWRPRLAEMTELLKIGIPSGVQIVADVLAWSLFVNWVMGAFGTRAMAANTFMFRYMSVSFMPAFGISVAVTALVGRYIGRGRPDIARARAHLGFALTGGYMLTCGLVFLLCRNQLIGLFTTDPQVLETGAMLLVFAAIYQFFDAMYIIYNGALRGAGDTFIPALATALLNWGITVFGGRCIAVYLASHGHAGNAGVAGPWVLATCYGVILGLFMFIRFQRGRWDAIHLEDGSGADTLRGFEVVPVR